MTAVGATTAQLFSEALAAGVYTLWGCLAYQVFASIFCSRRLCLQVALHCLFFAAAGVVSFCWLIGTTVSRAPRWYMAAAACVAIFVYKKMAAPIVGALLRFAGMLVRGATWPLRALLRKAGTWAAKELKHLQMWHGARYNARRKRRDEQRAQRKETDGNIERETTRKRAIQASAQT